VDRHSRLLANSAHLQRSVVYQRLSAYIVTDIRCLCGNGASVPRHIE
jgi:hypothetical protein